MLHVLNRNDQTCGQRNRVNISVCRALTEMCKGYYLDIKYCTLFILLLYPQIIITFRNVFALKNEYCNHFSCAHVQIQNVCLCSEGRIQGLCAAGYFCLAGSYNFTPHGVLPNAATNNNPCIWGQVCAGPCPAGIISNNI